MEAQVFTAHDKYKTFRESWSAIRLPPKTQLDCLGMQTLSTRRTMTFALMKLRSLVGFRNHSTSFYFIVIAQLMQTLMQPQRDGLWCLLLSHWAALCFWDVLCNLNKQAHSDDGADRDKQIICTAIIHQQSAMCGPWGRGILLSEDIWAFGPTCTTWSSLQLHTETPRIQALSNTDSSVLTRLQEEGGVTYVTVTQLQSSTSIGIWMSNRLHLLWGWGQELCFWLKVVTQWNW